MKKKDLIKLVDDYADHLNDELAYYQDMLEKAAKSPAFIDILTWAMNNVTSKIGDVASFKAKIKSWKAVDKQVEKLYGEPLHVDYGPDFGIDDDEDEDEK